MNQQITCNTYLYIHKFKMILHKITRAQIYSLLLARTWVNLLYYCHTFTFITKRHLQTWVSKFNIALLLLLLLNPRILLASGKSKYTNEACLSKCCEFDFVNIVLLLASYFRTTIAKTENLSPGLCKFSNYVSFCILKLINKSVIPGTNNVQ